MPTIENNTGTTASSIYKNSVVSSSCNHDVKHIFLVKSPLTVDWILIKTEFGDSKTAYLVCDDKFNIKYYAGGCIYDIDKSGSKLISLFDNIGSGWSREATLNELISMTTLSAKLDELIGDLVSKLNKDSELTSISLLSA